eukprot:731551-Pleurochrysis_carterae.AAC.4
MSTAEEAALKPGAAGGSGGDGGGGAEGGKKGGNGGGHGTVAAAQISHPASTIPKSDRQKMSPSAVMPPGPLVPQYELPFTRRAS